MSQEFDEQTMHNSAIEDNVGMIVVPHSLLDASVESIWTTSRKPSNSAVPESETMLHEEDEEAEGQVINYYFPIEIEVIGGLSQAHMQQVAEHVYNELTDAIQSQGLVV